MLKLVLNSVNVDLGWGKDKCYSKVKDMDLSVLLADEHRAKCCNNDVDLDGYLQYYVFDVYFGSEDIPVLDKAMLGIKTAVDSGALLLFDSYSNYVKAKESGANSFKLVTSDLADYDVECVSVLELVDKIYLKEDTEVNLVAYDYVNNCLQTIPFTSTHSKDTEFDDVVLFNSIPALFDVPYVNNVRYTDNCNISLAVLKSMFIIGLWAKDFEVCE